MNPTFELSAMPLPPADPAARPLSGPTDLRDPGGRAFVATWLAHVQAGRIGGNPPFDNALRDQVLANERVICGRQRSGLD
jgi:hypothetical protein